MYMLSSAEVYCGSSFPYFVSCLCYLTLSLFFFNAPAPTEIYTLSLHDALPISPRSSASDRPRGQPDRPAPTCRLPCGDRKSTRLNSSHVSISYAVFCLKKKKKEK